MPRSTQSSRTKAIQVLLVDDHPLWRDTLQTVLEHAGCAVVGMAANGEEAVEIARKVRPHVIVMDVNLPGMDGIGATERLLSDNPEAHVLALSSSDEPSAVVRIVKAGASGYLVKTAGGAEVVDAVRRIHAGELVFPPALAGLVLAEVRKASRDDEAATIRVVLADPTLLTREGLTRLLVDAGIDVVGVADDAVALMNSMESAQPDVAVIDVSIASQRAKNGRRLVQSLRQRFPRMGILVLSAEVQEAQALKLMSAGARGIGYLLKERVSTVEGLVGAIRRVGVGEPVVDREVVDRLVGRPSDRSSLALLTEREREVLSLMAEGRSNQAICERLFINPKSVETYVRNIFTKLGLEPAPDDHRRVLAVLAFLRS